MDFEDERTGEIADGLARIRRRLASACGAVGRDPAEVTLIAVTKTYPAEDVRRLARLGVRDVGENRDQEAAAKAAEVAATGADLVWHFVGQLQRNKARSVVRYADVVHSVDGVRLVRALDDAVGRYRDRPLDALVQVSLDGDPARGGALVGGDTPDRDLDRVLAAVAELDGLRLRGVMAVAPIDATPGTAFDRLAGVAARVRAAYPAATWLSAGMSGDLEEAVKCGSTHVRVGTALLGKRALLR